MRTSALQEGAILIDGHDFETVAAFGDQVKTAVGILFDDGDDFGGASHFGETLFEGPNHSENAILAEALRNHFFVARFENVQRQKECWEVNDVEREQGDEGRQARSPEG